MEEIKLAAPKWTKREDPLQAMEKLLETGDLPPGTTKEQLQAEIAKLKGNSKQLEFVSLLKDKITEIMEWWKKWNPELKWTMQVANILVLAMVDRSCLNEFRDPANKANDVIARLGRWSYCSLIGTAGTLTYQSIAWCMEREQWFHDEALFKWALKVGLPDPLIRGRDTAAKGQVIRFVKAFVGMLNLCQDVSSLRKFRDELGEVNGVEKKGKEDE